MLVRGGGGGRVKVYTKRMTRYKVAKEKKKRGREEEEEQDERKNGESAKGKSAAS